jgi:diguanylate cyclase (GGDEF)-like protein/PAS domain S-box-containing protein
MTPFQHWSIRHKLTALFVAMACITALTVVGPMITFDLMGLRRAMARDLATLADVLARNSTAALIFHDERAARDVLQALHAEPSVSAACIYRSDGEPFAAYVRGGDESKFVAPTPEPQASRFESGKLLQFREIVLDGEAVGTIYLESDLRRLDIRLRQYIAALMATLMVAMMLAWLTAARLQTPISRPLLKLVETTKAISERSDYSIRTELVSHDEFGMLAAEFNGMLDQIQERDRQLREHRERLEQEVEWRTIELLEANSQLRRAEEKYRAIFEDAVVGIFQITPEGRPLSANRALARMHGFDTPEQLLAEISDVGAQLFVHPEQMQEMREAVEREGLVRSAEVEVYHKNGSKRWALVNMRAVRDAAGKVVLEEGTVEDITDRKQAEERVEFLAYYDALTGLPNRRLLQDRLGNALASANRRDEKVALLFLDLDRFKIINDSLGHSVGDLLLQEVAERLKKVLRAQDTVARIGGDEFLIVLSGIKDAPDAAVAAEHIMDAMTPEFVVQGHSLSVSCSMGLSVFPEHGADVETLIKNADAAMYSAKDRGRHNYRFFTDDMNAQVVERLTIENALRMALERQELSLVYQPQVEIASGKIIGLEALMRWQHPELGIVPPDKFIRVAENSGLILRMGEWALRTACLQTRKWQDEGMPEVRIAVNVSALQFRQDGFREVIGKVLSETRLPSRCLELEITESLLLSNADVMFFVLQDLKKMGLKLAIDDFGTGYSSLSYLRHFPVSKLKIDRSFVRDLAVNPDDTAITKAIISMAKGLNLKVIAEGVENDLQMSFLRAHGCDEIQGYFFSRPLPAEEVPELLRKHAGLGLHASLGAG